MCGRFDLTATTDQLMQAFGGVPAEQPRVRYNVAPKQSVLTFRQEPSAGRVWRMQRWGLLPFWAKDESVVYKYKTFNAVGEEIHEKRSYKGPFRNTRCLIPVTGFYEWQEVRPKVKQPYRIVRRDRKPFTLAGIYWAWTNPDTGEVIDTCSVITIRPNKVMAPLHDRMPVILGEEDHQAWLDLANHDVTALKTLLKPCPSDWIEAYPVSTLVNNWRNDVPQCIERCDPGQ